MTFFLLLATAVLQCVAPSDARAKIDAWEGGERQKTLDWFARTQFGVTPIGRLPDEVFGSNFVAFTNAGIKIEIECVLPKAGKGPFPVFIFGSHATDHRNGHRKTRYDNLPADEIAARGYAFVHWNFNDVAPDTSRWDDLSRWPLGILAYVATGDKTRKDVTRSRDGWGTIGAWAWGNSRVMDWIEKQPNLDVRHVAIVGHSRGGKTALWTAAQDARFAMAVSNGSGCGGASLARARKNDGGAEMFKDILHNFPNWFAPAFQAYAGRDATVEHDADDLMRLIAPRALYVASGSQDKWAGPATERAAWEAAHDLYRAYGCEGNMAYHCHEGPHKLRPDDWMAFLDFADSLGWRRK